MRTSDAARKKPELDARLGTPDLLTLMPPPPPPPLPLTPPTADAKEAENLVRVTLDENRIRSY